MTSCPVCSGPTRETTHMICMECGTDYAAKPPHKISDNALTVLRAALSEVRQLRADRDALAAAVKTVATALDQIGGRIYRDLRDEYDDIAGRVCADDAKMLREFMAYADEQLAVLDDPKVRAALGETGGTDA